MCVQEIIPLAVNRLIFILRPRGLKEKEGVILFLKGDLEPVPVYHVYIIRA